VLAPRVTTGNDTQRVRRLIHVVALCCVASLNCTAQPPDVEPQPSKLTDAGGSAFVDLVLSYTESGNPVTCTDSIAPVCQTQTGDCSDHPVLGAPDSQSFSLVGPGQIEVGFLCQPIVDRAPNSELSPDFRVWATIESGTGAIVSVSEDGSNYVVLDNLIRNDQTFDLANRGLEYARFLRIAVEAGATLQIDSIEALP
jgi:hypothetical protein